MAVLVLALLLLFAGCRGSAPTYAAPAATTVATLPPHPDSETDIFRVSVTPASGPPGTVIRIEASCPSTAGTRVEFADRTVVRAGVDAAGKPLAAAKPLAFQVVGTSVTSTYTVTTDDARGNALVNVYCGGKQGLGGFLVM